MIASMLLRIALAIALVAATWNPAGLSYVHWALVDTDAFGAGKALVGVLLLAGWILCAHAAWVSLGATGVTIVAAIIAVFVWWLFDLGVVTREQTTVLAWIGVAAIGTVLGIGMGWSLVRQKATGQVEAE